MDDILTEFLVESNELLDQLETDLGALETQPASTELLSSIFRCLHTIKGGCGFLDFKRLESLSHAGETLLGAMRDGEVVGDKEVFDLLYELADATRTVMQIIESTGADVTSDCERLTESLKVMRTNKQLTSAQKEDRARGFGTVKASVSGTEAVELQGFSDMPLGEILVAQGLINHEDVVIAMREQENGDPRHLGEVLVARGCVSSQAIREALEIQIETKNAERSSTVVENSIRVDVLLLDKLMNLVGELVLARNQVQQHTRASQDIQLLRSSQRLNLITTELQAGVMKTRMQPIGNVWNKFPRVVRHLCVVCDKKVRIEMDGKETELDKTIIEAIRDPLTHFVRNSVDHGIEATADREKSGKNREGVVRLRAFHEGGQVNMEISDDGRGIDPAVIRKKALAQNLVSASQLEKMDDHQVTNLVFLPGFSTASKITSVSGRGVGMDVVKTNIERIGGTVDLHSQVGVGTTLKIKIPLTLAIIPALLVSVGDGKFALPQISLLELVRLGRSDVETRIEYVNDVPVYRLRGELLPLIYLRSELKMSGSEGHQDQINIVVLQVDGRTFGLVVDSVEDTAEIVVKPLGRQLKGIKAFAGATILGDGSVALILDVMGLAQKARIVGDIREGGATDLIASADQDVDGRQQLLLFELGEQRRVAIPLLAIDRLEELSTDDVERSGEREVVQYRGSILPLIRVADVIGARSSGGEDDTLRVLVYNQGRTSVGLVVDHIIDIVEQADPIQSEKRSHPCFVGSTIIHGRVTDLLDAAEVIRSSGLYDESRRLAA